MKNFKTVSSLLMSTVLIASATIGLADNYNGANREDYSVQNYKTYDEDSKDFSKDSNFDSVNSISPKVSVKDEKQENKTKDMLFAFEQGYKKSKEEIEQCRVSLLEIRKNIESNYSKTDLDKINIFTEQLKKTYNNITVLSFKDVIVKHSDIIFDTPPIIKNARTLIPIRALAEGFGAEVLWNPENREVTVTRDGNRIVLKTNEKTAQVNGRKVTLDVEASIYGDRTYVPLRFIGENLGVDIEWDEDLRIIKVKEKDSSVEDNSYNVM